MKSYITEVKDGHHVVRMLSDKEIEAIEGFIEFVKDLWDRLKEMISEIWEDIHAYIESLPEESKEELLNEHTENQETTP